MRRKKVLITLGTRPEAIKMAPVIAALRGQPDAFDVDVVSTGQHREILDQTLAFFGIEADLDLGLMTENQTLQSLTARTISRFSEVLHEGRPDWVLVQGDTITAMAAGLAAFQDGVPVGHVEAGLRSGNRLSPFPEEVNRRIISTFAALHFAPTSQASRSLLDEGQAPETVHMTGNTIVDALNCALEHLESGASTLSADLLRSTKGKPVMLLTSHRRENFDQGLANICHAVRRLVDAFPDLLVVFPVHPNPRVRDTVHSLLGDIGNIRLCEPLGYGSLVELLRLSTLILTDSGGIQEEASTIGRPIIVARTETERREAIDSGNAVLAGVGEQAIFETVSRVLSDDTLRSRMSQPASIFGDGRAAERIASILKSS